MTDMTTPLPAGFFGDYSEAGDRAKIKRQIKAAEAGLESCETCGRGVAVGKGWVVVVTGGGSHALHPDADMEAAEQDSGFMGAYLVGPECGRKVPIAYRTKYAGFDGLIPQGE